MACGTIATGIGPRPFGQRYKAAVWRIEMDTWRHGDAGNGCGGEGIVN